MQFSYYVGKLHFIVGQNGRPPRKLPRKRKEESSAPGKDQETHTNLNISSNSCSSNPATSSCWFLMSMISLITLTLYSSPLGISLYFAVISLDFSFLISKILVCRRICRRFLPVTDIVSNSSTFNSSRSDLFLLSLIDCIKLTNLLARRVLT